MCLCKDKVLVNSGGKKNNRFVFTLKNSCVGALSKEDEYGVALLTAHLKIKFFACIHAVLFQ